MERNLGEERYLPLKSGIEGDIEARPDEVEADLPFYFELCDALNAALTGEQRMKIMNYALVACHMADWHRATAIDWVQRRTGLPHRLAEQFIEQEFERVHKESWGSGPKKSSPISSRNC